MRLHILGICGSFMGGVALLARAAGHRVTGSDSGVYPPMSDQLAAAGIAVLPLDDLSQLEPPPDVVVVGNALSRGRPVVEALLNRGLRYCSGPQWLAENILAGRHALAVAGTHGKTTTAAMLAWILECAGQRPGFLIGGAPGNFDHSARLGDPASPFVIEADEYDAAFFDKRSKFLHYRPRTLAITNLEYDHADIFPDLAAIQRQFHHLLRTVPGNGRVIHPAGDAAVDEVLAMGCWSERERVDAVGEMDNGADGADRPATWRAAEVAPDGGRFAVLHNGEPAGETEWSLSGRHNVANALCAVAAAHHVGVAPAVALDALRRFAGVRRRLERRGAVDGVVVYDDFAHHPTAIAATLEGLRARIPRGAGRLLAVFEPRSNTMRMGVHRARLPAAFAAADALFFYAPPDLAWDAEELTAGREVDAAPPLHLYTSIDALIAALAAEARRGDQIVVMSNGAFGALHERLLTRLRAQRPETAAMADRTEEAMHRR